MSQQLVANHESVQCDVVSPVIKQQRKQTPVSPAIDYKSPQIGGLFVGIIA
jgi:hypothetical protein